MKILWEGKNGYYFLRVVEFSDSPEEYFVEERLWNEETWSTSDTPINVEVALHAALVDARRALCANKT